MMDNMISMCVQLIREGALTPERVPPFIREAVLKELEGGEEDGRN